MEAIDECAFPSCDFLGIVFIDSYNRTYSFHDFHPSLVSHFSIQRYWLWDSACMDRISSP